jgi:NAD(P)-dependent dehydrogenase (short-subunit alcohol dehydrogenase family)
MVAAGEPLPDGLGALVAVFDGADLPFGSTKGGADRDWDDALGRASQRLFRSVRDAAAAMDARGSGSVVVVAPEAGLVAVRGAAIIAAAAGALFASARTLAVEYAPTVRLNMLAYGCVEGDPFSEWLRAEDPNGIQALEDESLTLLERFAQPAEVGNAAAFLASDRASFVIAHQLVVDGGYVIH